MFVVFVLVLFAIFHDGTPRTEGDKEQVLAAMVPTLGLSGLVHIFVGPLPHINPQLPGSGLDFWIHKTREHFSVWGPRVLLRLMLVRCARPAFELPLGYHR